jgi:hypothetical protein
MLIVQIIWQHRIPSRNAFEVLRRTNTCFNQERYEGEIKTHVNEIHLKVIALGLVLVFVILSFALPKTASTTILLGVVMIAGVAVSFIGMSMHKQDAEDHDDLLAVPPKK